MKISFGNKNPFTIKFFQYDDGKGKIERMIYCRIFMDDRKTEFSLNIACRQEEWDEEQQGFIPTTKYFRHLNFKLSEIKGKIEEYYTVFQKKGAVITAKLLKDAFRGKVSVEKPKAYTLLEFIDVFIAEIKLKPAEYGLPTIKKYYALKVHLNKYYATIGIKDVYLDTITISFLDKFQTHLTVTPHEQLGYPMCRNTSNMYMIKFRTVLGNACRKELINRNPFDKLKLKQVKTNITYLTIEEFRRMENHPLGNNAALERVRDIFCFCTYTALRFSDGSALRERDVFPGDDGKYWISIKQAKTDDPLVIPMLNAAETIYKKYEYERKKTGFVLPRLSNQKMNIHLKEIARLCNIQKDVTSHVARHTFATSIAMENGLSLKTVSKFLGHRNISATEIYAQVTRTQLSASADLLNKKLMKEEEPELIKELIRASSQFLN